MAGIESEYRFRQKICWHPQPIEALFNGQRVAATYFSCLPGDLAMLGGVRAVTGAENLAADLVRSQIQSILQRPVKPHIQAAIADSEPASQEIVRAAGLQPLTAVDQLWISLVDEHITQPIEEAPLRRQPEFQWRPASEISLLRFERLLGATFDGTLDCPELNDMRSNRQVLQSFLMNRSLRRCPHWFTLWQRNQPVGCLLLLAHHKELVELVYMGLVPQARGQQLGQAIIQQAKWTANQLGATMLVLAADVRNTPAIKTYKQCGFQFHRRLQVYWIR